MVAITVENDIDTEKLYSFGVLQAASDENLWYEMNAIKNRARSAVHLEGATSRLHKVEVEATRLAVEVYAGDVPYNIISTLFRRFASNHRKDESLASFFNGLSFWFLQQIQNIVCCRWTFDGVVMTERNQSFQSDVLNVLCSIGKFIGRNNESFSWEFREHFSNAYLYRLLKIIPKSKSKNLKDMKCGVVETGILKRDNVHGEKEDYTTYCANQLQCPLF